MGSARKRWFRVASSLYREPWPRDVKLTMVMLCAYLNDRWARDGLTAEEACTAVISAGDLHAITGRAQRVHAERALRAFSVHVTCTIRERNGLIEIHWPKFAEFQHLPPESGTGAVPKPPPTRHATRATPPQQEPNPRKRVPPPRWAVDCSALLVDLLGPVPGASIPAGAPLRWAREIEKMATEVPELRAKDDDARGVLVEAGIRFALGETNLGSEYQVVIRSGASLRAKWPKLVRAAQRDTNARKPQEDFAAWMHSETS